MSEVVKAVEKDIKIYVIGKIDGIDELIKELGKTYTEVEEDRVEVLKNSDFCLFIIKNELKNATGMQVAGKIREFNTDANIILITHSPPSIDLIRKAISFDVMAVHKVPLNKDKVKADVKESLTRLERFKRRRERLEELKEKLRKLRGESGVDK